MVDFIYGGAGAVGGMNSTVQCQRVIDAVAVMPEFESYGSAYESPRRGSGGGRWDTVCVAPPTVSGVLQVFDAESQRHDAGSPASNAPAAAWEPEGLLSFFSRFVFGGARGGDPGRPDFGRDFGRPDFGRPDFVSTGRAARP